MVCETGGSYQIILVGPASADVTQVNKMAIDVRKGQGDVKLTRQEFERRLRERFYDPDFENVDRELAAVVDVAWRAYDEYHKSPRKRKAGPGFADPEFDCRSSGSRRASGSSRPSASRKIRDAPVACSWYVERRATIRPVPAKCRRRSGWPRRRAKRSSAPACSATSST
jgi:hypothetical protein